MPSSFRTCAFHFYRSYAPLLHKSLSGRKATFAKVQDFDMFSKESSPPKLESGRTHSLALYLVLHCLPWRPWLCPAGCVGSHSQLSPWKGKESTKWPSDALIGSSNCGFLCSRKLPSSSINLRWEVSLPVPDQRAYLPSRATSLYVKITMALKFGNTMQQVGPFYIPRKTLKKKGFPSPQKEYLSPQQGGKDFTEPAQS